MEEEQRSLAEHQAEERARLESMHQREIQQRTPNVSQEQILRQHVEEHRALNEQFLSVKTRFSSYSMKGR